ncbi:lipopolysaccharide biosynthesis protein [Streptomyces sp. NPDC020362]|uniref:lipopolysaccharide biosynthesis protein n=1 Tax=unclassified Streptomyces TaxID=2593676 RepID=UPI0033DFA726
MTDNPKPAGLPRRISPRAARLLLRAMIPAAALLGAAAGGVYAVAKPPQYTATSYVIAVPAGRAKADPVVALGFAQVYGRVVTQPAVLGQAQERAGVPVAKLRKSVRAATSPDAPMVAIMATAERPGRAAAISNAVSRALIEQVSKTENATGVGLVHLSRAVNPTEPSSQSPVLTALVGASAGGLLAGLALLARRRPAAPEGDNTRAQLPAPAVASDTQGASC